MFRGGDLLRRDLLWRDLVGSCFGSHVSRWIGVIVMMMTAVRLGPRGRSEISCTVAWLDWRESSGAEGVHDLGGCSMQGEGCGE